MDVALPHEATTARHDRVREVRHVVPRLLAGGAAVYVFLAVVGLLLTRTALGAPLVRNDRGVARWWFEQRTPAWNRLTHLGSTMSDTATAIAVTAVAVLVLLLLRRIRAAVAITLSISGELFVFLLVTATVHRQRPAVPHLDPAPPTSSFPSGHTGAAVALYVGLAVVVLVLSRGARARPLAVLAAAVLCLVPVVVALSRMYRGMHFLTDVVAGALAGGLWMVIVMRTVLLARRAPADG